jgi:hypothetical protein
MCTTKPNNFVLLGFHPLVKCDFMTKVLRESFESSSSIKGAIFISFYVIDLPGLPIIGSVSIGVPWHQVSHEPQVNLHVVENWPIPHVVYRFLGELCSIALRINFCPYRNKMADPHDLPSCG